MLKKVNSTNTIHRQTKAGVFLTSKQQKLE